jgi:predicted cupin superfamily sugar epimerase
MADDASRSAELVDNLQLKHLNVESGLFNVVGVSDITVTCEGEDSPASNAIYLALNQDEPLNFLQWVFSDDYQVLIEGGPADYYLFYADGRSEKITMGRDVAAGQQLIVPAPGGTSKAIVLHDAAEYLLVGSVLSPAWSPHRTRIGGDEAFVEKYHNSSDWATSEWLTKLIGPNYGHYTGGETDVLELSVTTDGQVIWLGMQLDEKQLADQLGRFSRQYPGKEAVLKVDDGAPASVVELTMATASSQGVEIKQPRSGKSRSGRASPEF